MCRKQCPKCGSDNSEKSGAEGDFIVAPRRCLDCRHEYEPPAPIWLLVTGLLVCGGLLGAMATTVIVAMVRGEFRVNDSQHIPSPLGMIFLTGMATIVYKCFTGLREQWRGRNERQASV